MRWASTEGSRSRSLPIGRSCRVTSPTSGYSGKATVSRLSAWPVVASQAEQLRRSDPPRDRRRQDRAVRPQRGRLPGHPAAAFRAPRRRADPRRRHLRLPFRLRPGTASWRHGSLTAATRPSRSCPCSPPPAPPSAGPCATGVWPSAPAPTPTWPQDPGLHPRRHRPPDRGTHLIMDADNDQFLKGEPQQIHKALTGADAILVTLTSADGLRTTLRHASSPASTRPTTRPRPGHMTGPSRPSRRSREGYALDSAARYRSALSGLLGPGSTRDFRQNRAPVVMPATSAPRYGSPRSGRHLRLAPT